MEDIIDRFGQLIQHYVCLKDSDQNLYNSKFDLHLKQISQIIEQTQTDLYHYEIDQEKLNNIVSKNKLERKITIELFKIYGILIKSNQITSF
uniref:Uncharacterized protein n=1 Tax=viral metagenome TaxID=1070528 RepID=A0A6C0LQ45_9ZZZZ